ncbi:hypothetical protein D3C77_470910 [compost metagenome]
MLLEKRMSNKLNPTALTLITVVNLTPRESFSFLQNRTLPKSIPMPNIASEIPISKAV